jgi:hypothetical protein
MNNKEPFNGFDKMTLREVLEYSKITPLTQGGLDILMEKIVREIEKLQNENPKT